MRQYIQIISYFFQESEATLGGKTLT